MRCPRRCLLMVRIWSTAISASCPAHRTCRRPRQRGMQSGGERADDHGFEVPVHLIATDDHHWPDLANLSARGGIQIGNVHGIPPGKRDHQSTPSAMATSKSLPVLRLFSHWRGRSPPKTGYGSPYPARRRPPPSLPRSDGHSIRTCPATSWEGGCLWSCQSESV